MIRTECSDSLVEDRLLLGLEERSADPDTLLVRAHRIERIDSDAVVHQFLGQLQVGHAWILDGEVESIGQWLAHVVVIHQIESVLEEHLLEEGGPASIFLHLVDEVEASVTGSLHHRSHAVLHAVAAARRKGVDDARIEESAELGNAKQILQRLILAMIESIRHAADTDALASVREGLRA